MDDDKELITDGLVCKKGYDGYIHCRNMRPVAGGLKSTEMLLTGLENGDIKDSIYLKSDELHIHANMKCEVAKVDEDDIKVEKIFCRILSEEEWGDELEEK